MACMATLGAMSPVWAQTPALLAEEAGFADRWHRNEGDGELTYIGKPAAGGVTLKLQREALLDRLTHLDFTTDATRLSLTAGGESVEVPLSALRGQRVSLDGRRRSPRVLIADRELADLRGRWLRLLLLTPDAQLTLTCPDATFANLRTSSGDGLAVTTQAVRQATGQPPQSATDPLPPLKPSKPVEATPDAPGPTPIANGELAAPQRRDQGVDLVRQTPGESVEDVHATRWTPHLRLGVKLPSAYYFRGFGYENQGFIAQPYIDGRLTIIDEDLFPSFLDSVDLILGVRSSHHYGPTKFIQNNPDKASEKFVELDFSGGFGVKAFDRWQFEAIYFNRIGVNDSFLIDVHEVQFIARFDDHDPDHDAQLWPYAMIAIEGQGESDGGNRRRNFSDGVYLELGLRPTIPLNQPTDGRPVTLVLPSAVGLSLLDYYQDQTGRGQAFGYFQTGLELVVPLSATLGDPGRNWVWNLRTGVDVLIFGDSLRRLNEFRGVRDDSVTAIFHIGLELVYE